MMFRVMSPSYSTRTAVLLPVAFFLLLPVACSQSLTTTFANNNGQSGNMFDITALNDVTVNDFDCNLDSGSWTVEVYVVTGGGGWSGNQTTASAWTLIGTASVVGAGPGLPTPLGLSLGYTVAAGATQGFYVTCSNGRGMNYTNGTGVGNVAAADANCQIHEGLGKSYPFGATFMPRIWNGTLHYTTGPPVEPLVATTTGVGDLFMSGPDDPAGAIEGFVLLSTTLAGPVGSGPFAGIYPDALTLQILMLPPVTGDLLHYFPDPNSFPNQDVTLPPGSLTTLIGLSFDGVLIQVSGLFGSLDISNAVRINF